MAPPPTPTRKLCLLAVSTAMGAALGAFVSMITNFALVEISVSPMFSVYFGGLFILVGCLILWRVASHEAAEPLPLPKLHLAVFAGIIVLSGFLCFLLDRKMFVGLRPWMKVPLYTVLGSAVSFAMTFAIVDVLNYVVGLCQASLAKPIVESAHQVSLVLCVSLAMGMAFGFTFGVLDVADEDEYHIRMALLRDEKYSQPVGIALGALAGLGLEFVRQRDDYSMLAAGKTEFDEDI
mmetsp:Transcript_86970/g.241186  ORF Transcript_86970/g.241186 Transcript_86970/m.241186 type:complete len:236 (+) Transcript_86970:73-780(+)